MGAATRPAMPRNLTTPTPRAVAAALPFLAVTLTATETQANLAVPPVVANGHQKDLLVHDGLLDVTLYGADPTGMRDSTKALQAAINDARDYVMTAYLPPGTYLVSDTLTGAEDGSGSGGSFCYRVQNDYGSAFGGELVAAQAPTLVGPPSGQRAVIKLADASPGFADPSAPKPAIHFVDNGPPSQYVNPVVGAFDCLMYSVIRDVDVDLGTGNTGAVGIQFYSAQFSYMANVTVHAHDAYAGIQGAPATSDWVDVAVDGGRYGIVIDNAGTSSLVGVTLSDQSVAGLSLSGAGAISVAGFRITESTGAAVALSAFKGVDQITGFSLVDGAIEQSSAAHAAIANPDGVNLLVQNVTLRTPAALVQSRNQAPVTGSSGGDRVIEYAYTDTSVTGGDYAPSTSYDLIDGVVGQKGTSKVDLGVGPAPQDIVLRHLPGPLPWPADPGVVDATTFGADPTGYGDSTSAIQKAIDASLGKGDEVFLPRGNYLLSGTLQLHPDTRLFGVPGPKTTLWASTWDPHGKYVPFVQTADTALGKTFVGDLQLILPNDDRASIATGYAQSYLGALDWRAGRSSTLYHVSVQLMPDWGSVQPSSAPRKVIHVEGNGGGRWYGLQMGGAFDYARDNNPDFRFVFVDGTSAPLTLYGANLEHAESDDFVEIANASNVRVFETKTECRSTWAAVEGSKNVLITGVGGDWAPENPKVGLFSAGSSNVEFAILGWYSNSGDPSAYYVYSTGGGYPDGGVSYVDGVSVFQEGTFDDTPFPHCGDGICDGAESSANCAHDCGSSPGPADGGTPIEGGSPTAPAASDGGNGADGAGSAPGGCACSSLAAPGDGGAPWALFAAVGTIAALRRGPRLRP